jgi:hypothetical protein
VQAIQEIGWNLEFSKGSPLLLFFIHLEFMQHDPGRDFWKSACVFNFQSKLLFLIISELFFGGSCAFLRSGSSSID